MEKIKVLQFTVAATKGGRTFYVLNNWKYIDKTKFQFDFITFNPKLDFEQQLIDEGCNVYHMSCYPEENREQFIKEFDAILDRHYDVIHIHTSFWKDTIVEQRAMLKGVKKVIIHSHNMGCSSAWLKESDEETLKRHYEVQAGLSEEIATDFWACSVGAAKWLYGDKINKNKIKIIKNAIDTRQFSYNPDLRAQVRKELNMESMFVIGHIGQLIYQKNPKFLIEVYNEVQKKYSNAVLLLKGDGDLRDAIEEQVRSLGLTDKVCFIDFQKDISKYYQAMDVFVFPSFFEGFPSALIEAQTAGLPCLCSDRISDEVLLTENIQQLSLDNIDVWVDKILDLRQRYERKDCSKLISDAGYDLLNQVKELEKEYMIAKL